ncbi:MAG: hypothetical protein ACYC8T_03665 [Myxococcaceae bacterium]
MDAKEAIGRWESFLGKLCARAADTLAEAEQGCAMLLDLNSLDPMPMSNAWTAVENQLRELASKVDQTWEEKVEPALEAAQLSGGRLDAERAKGEALRRSIERDQESASVRIFAAAARKILAQAKENLSKDFRCKQCSAPLALSDRFFRSRHLTCPNCANVNTFVPGTQVQAVEYFCCHHLAKEKTQALWGAWLDAERGPRPAAERALRAYTEAYLLARIEIVPEYQKDFERDLKGKMAFFYA